MIEKVIFLKKQLIKTLILEQTTITFIAIVFTFIILSTGRLLLNILSNLENNMLDFGTYYYGVHNLLNNVNPYTFKPSLPIEGGMYVYPPSSFVIFFPLSFFSLAVNKVLFTFFSLFLFWMIFWLLKKMICGKRYNGQFFLLMLFLTETYSVKSNFLFGQMNIVILFLITISLYLYKNSLWSETQKKFQKNSILYLQKKISYFLSIVFFTIGAGIKIIPLFLLPLFLLRKDWLFFSSVIILFVALNFAVSPDLTKKYFIDTFQYHSLESYPSIIDISFPAFAMRLTNNIFIAKLLQYIFLLSMYSAAIFIMRKRHLSIFPGTKKFPSDTFDSFLSASAFVLSVITIDITPSWRQYILYSYPLLFLIFISYLLNRKFLLKHGGKFIFIFIILWIALDFHFDEWTTYSIPQIILTYQTIIVLMLEFYFIFFTFMKRKN